MLKPIVAYNGDTGIFFLQTKDLRGFQYGNPRDQTQEIVDDLFVEGGKIEFTFLENCAGISQSEINRVIQTVRRVSPR